MLLLLLRRDREREVSQEVWVHARQPCASRIQMSTCGGKTRQGPREVCTHSIPPCGSCTLLKTHGCVRLELKACLRTRIEETKEGLNGKAVLRHHLLLF